MRSVFVTGAAGGIGSAICATLAEGGYPVIAADFDLDGARRVADEVVNKGGTATAVQIDVTDPASTEKAIDDGVEAVGELGHAVAAAGIITIRPFLEVGLDEWRRQIDVNLAGVFLTIQSVAKRLADGKGGSILAFASVAGRGPRPDSAAYAASKAGVISVVESAAKALGPLNIRVNALCPGVVRTEMTTSIHERRGAALGISLEESLAQMASNIPLGRVIETDELAGVARFMLSDEAAYITGQALNVCGGLEYD